MDNKLKFKTIAKESSKSVNLWEKKEDYYIKFGEYNDMPNQLISLMNHSSIHNTCINSIVDGIIGNGLTSDKSYILDKANNEGESWNDIFKKVALDYKLFGGFALEVIWSVDRSKIAEVYHIDFSYLRAKEKNHRGKIPGYYISDEWGFKYRYSPLELKDVPYLPCFNPETNEDEPSQIYVHQPYRPGMRYYPLPDYIGAFKVIELDTQVDNFHINNIMNGLAPSLAITTFTNANEEERNAIENMLRIQYQGTNNAGNLIYMDVDSPDNAPKIEPIPQNGADSYYTDINDMVTQKILTAHRITSPMILGIKTEGQLGGRAEVTDAYLLLLNTVIRPYQQSILDCFEYLLQFNYGDDFLLGIEQLKLFSDDEEEVDVVTGAEAESGEDNKLEAQIEQSDEENAPTPIDTTIQPIQE